MAQHMEPKNGKGPPADETDGPAPRPDDDRTKQASARVQALPQRRRLPNKRRGESFEVEFQGQRFHVTAGYFDGDGVLAELFITARKSGSMLADLARDAGILLSISLQSGADVGVIKRALTRGADGSASSLLGAVIDEIEEGAL